MTFPVQITFRDIETSDAVAARIEERAKRLERINKRIVGCHVVVAAPHRHAHKGTLYSIQIDLTLPGGELVVNREHHDKHAHEDAYVAIRDAFNAMEKQLKGRTESLSGEVKAHEAPPHGQIARLFDDYGFIDAGTFGEVFFHRNAVVEGRFEDLAVGGEVRFALAPDDSENGPQASTVHPIGKHHMPEPGGL